MLTIYLNGEELQVPAESSLQEILRDRDPGPQPYAVAVNSLFVPRGLYGQTRLADGDMIELVIASQGG